MANVPSFCLVRIQLIVENEKIGLMEMRRKGDFVLRIHVGPIMNIDDKRRGAFPESPNDLPDSLRFVPPRLSIPERRRP